MNEPQENQTTTMWTQDIDELEKYQYEFTMHDFPERDDYTGELTEY